MKSHLVGWVGALWLGLVGCAADTTAPEEDEKGIFCAFDANDTCFVADDEEIRWRCTAVYPWSMYSRSAAHQVYETAHELAVERARIECEAEHTGVGSCDVSTQTVECVQGVYVDY